MKATEFAEFFDFTISLNTEGLVDDCDDEPTKYIVEDNQWCFHTRFINEVDWLTECFDSMLMDYIEDYIEEHGFEYDDDNDERTYYEAAAEWIADTELRDTDTAHTIYCLAAYEEIEDDVA